MNFYIGLFENFLILITYFNLGSIHIYNLNGPGFLMSVIWLLLQFVCGLCFYDRTTSKSQIKTDQNTHVEDIKQQLSSKTYREQYIRIEMFVLFLATFITYFNQTALETIVAKFTEEQFRWTIVHVSILFAFAGLEIIVVYILLVKCLSKKFEDRILLIFGFIIICMYNRNVFYLGIIFIRLVRHNKFGHDRQTFSFHVHYICRSRSTWPAIYCSNECIIIYKINTQRTTRILARYSTIYHGNWNNR